MTKAINKDLTPDEVDEVVADYLAKLKGAGLAFKEERIRADVRKRVADMNGLTPEKWEQKFTLAAAGTAPAPVGAAPAAPSPTPTRRKTAPTGASPAAAELAAEEADSKPATKEERIQKVRETAQSTDGSYFWTDPKELSILDTWIKMRSEAGIVQNLLVVGPSGSGKTEGLKRLAMAHNLPPYKIDCASITTSDKWVGQKNIVIEDGAPKTEYTLSEHLRWLGAVDCDPGLVIYDEITRLHPSLLNILIPILDGSQSIWVPDLGIYASVHPQTIIAATANIGAQFAGTYGLDVALHDRFAVIQERSFPPVAQERIVLEKRTGITPQEAATLVDIAVQVRAKHDQNLISRPLSTRALIDCGYWVAAGMSITDACETTWVKKYSDEGKGSSERTMVKLILQGKAGGK